MRLEILRQVPFFAGLPAEAVADIDRQRDAPPAGVRR
jgi:hypothetical protein